MLKGIYVTDPLNPVRRLCSKMHRLIAIAKSASTAKMANGAATAWGTYERRYVYQLQGDAQLVHRCD